MPQLDNLKENNSKYKPISNTYPCLFKPITTYGRNLEMNYENSNDDLMSLQIELEEGMTNRGMEKYLRDVAKAKQASREEGTAYGQTLLVSHINALAEAIQKWMDETSQGRAGNNATAYRKVKEMDPNTLAFLTLKNVLAGVSSVRTVQFVAVSIGTSIEDELRFAEIRETERKAYEKLVAGAKKRSAYHYKHMYAVRQAGRIDTWQKWERTERLHVGIKMLDLLVNNVGLVEITHQRIEKEQSVKYVRATPETLDWIERKNEVTSLLRPVYEPMVVQPRDWTDPYNGGYISSYIKPLKLVKTRNRQYLEELRNVEMPIVYEAINALQRTPWQINSQVLKVMTELWENGSTIAGLPSRLGVEMPLKPHDIETNLDSQKEYRIAAAKAHMENLSLTGKRIAFNISLNIAKRYEKFRRIFFPYQLDFRGRIYAVPHLNPQGADPQKALLRFASGKPLGAEGWKWLAVHGANVAGNDKISFEDRVNWVLDNEQEILACAENPFDHRGWCTQIADVEIDKPWQFLAFCFEWKGYCDHGEDFVSKIPVAMDGSCSGIQHFSAMLRDEKGGAAVNLVPAELPADVYRQVADKVIEMVNDDLANGTENTLAHTESGLAYVKEGTKVLAQQWLEFGITRKTTKRSVMTLAYGSKQYGFKEQLMEDIITPARLTASKTGERFPFSHDGYSAASYMAKKIWDSVTATLVKASEVMKWLQDVATVAAAEELPVRWTTPIGFPVMQAYADVQDRRVLTAINGKAVRLTMKHEKDKLDRRKQRQGIAPNFVHSCDAAHLMLTVVRAHQEDIHNFSMIHDSFGTTAGDAERMFGIIRESFVEMYENVDVLGDFCEEIRDQLSEQQQGNLPPLPEPGTLDIQQVVNSRYCFA
jgi:DNA-directed RNA polymerase, mitochondrial